MTPPHSRHKHSPHARSERSAHAHSSARRRHRQLSRIPKPLRVLAMPVLLLATVAFTFDARRENSILRKQVADLQAQLAAKSAPPSTPLGDPAELPEASTGTNQTAAPRVDPPPAVVSPGTPGHGALSAELRAALREAMAIRPNGALLPSGGAAPASRKQALAPFADELVAAYTAMAQNENEQATALLAAIAEAHPHWPYAYFYLAITTRDRSVMEHAQLIFGKAAQAGLLPLEGSFYWGMALLFTGDNQRARTQLTGLATRCVGVPLLLGPVYGPTDIPQDLQRSLDAIPGLPDIRRTEPLLVAPDANKRSANPDPKL